MAENSGAEFTMVPLQRVAAKLFEIKLPEVITTPRGEVIIGSTDPRGLTRKGFLQSPDLLFHGAAREFDFNPQFSFSDDHYMTDHTIGIGFYTTNDSEVAEDYSQIRQRGDDRPAVIPVLPYAARMYDFRAVEDPENNGLMPSDMIRDFSDYYRKWMKENFPQAEKISGMNQRRYNICLEFAMNLEALSDKNTPYDLRGVLDPEHLGHNPRVPMVGAFTRFMRGKGFDGIIYLEGGEYQHHKNAASFVFFNLDKVGTYDSWQTRKAS